jgi:hypothetical protein
LIFFVFFFRFLFFFFFTVFFHCFHFHLRVRFISLFLFCSRFCFLFSFAFLPSHASVASDEIILGFRNLELFVTASIREIFSNLSILRRNDSEHATQHAAIIARLYLSNRTLLTLLNGVDRALYARVPRQMALVDALIHDAKHFITLSVHIMKLLRAAVAREHVDVLYKDIALRVQAILTSMRLFPKGEVK